MPPSPLEFVFTSTLLLWFYLQGKIHYLPDIQKALLCEIVRKIQYTTSHHAAFSLLVVGFM